MKLWREKHEMKMLGPGLTVSQLERELSYYNLQMEELLQELISAEDLDSMLIVVDKAQQLLVEGYYE